MLTALYGDGREFDVTAATDEEWGALHRKKVHALSCKGCGSRVFLRESCNHVRHLYHRPGAHCDIDRSGESDQHRQLKILLARLIRQLGWVAQVECQPAGGDFGGWRADVMGVGAEGRRVAFEVQLSNQPVDIGNERSARYHRDGILCVWITTQPKPWVEALVSLRLSGDQETGYTVDAGLRRWGAVSGWWVQPSHAPSLKSVVDALLRGEYTPHQIRHLGQDRRVLVTPGDLQHESDYRAEAERKRAEREAAEQLHRANADALRDRQHAVLERIVPALIAQYGHDQVAVSGTEKRRAATILRAQAALDQDSWRASRVHRGGVTLHVNRGEGWKVVAVVCPVRSRCDPQFGATLRAQGAVVVAETRGEASRLAAVLGGRVVIAAEWPPIQPQRLPATNAPSAETPDTPPTTTPAVPPTNIGPPPVPGPIPRTQPAADPPLTYTAMINEALQPQPSIWQRLRNYFSRRL